MGIALSCDSSHVFLLLNLDNIRFNQALKVSYSKKKNMQESISVRKFASLMPRNQSYIMYITHHKTKVENATRHSTHKTSFKETKSEKTGKEQKKKRKKKQSGKRRWDGWCLDPFPFFFLYKFYLPTVDSRVADYKPFGLSTVNSFLDLMKHQTKVSPLRMLNLQRGQVAFVFSHRLMHPQ